MASLKSVFIIFLVLCISVFQVVVCAADYVGCFKQDFEIWIFRFPPGDYDSSRITPLTCLDLCSPRYKYAAISGGNACFCGNRINASLKVNNSLCATQCEGSRDGHVLGTCGGAFYESVYELKRGITGLELKVSEKVLVFSTTWFNASVFDGHETEFSFQIDDEVVSPFSTSSSVSHIFRKKGKHFVRVTARNEFTNIASVVKVVHVIDAMEGVQVQCPAVSLPGEEITCQGEWIRSTGNVKFYFGDETSENVLNDAPSYRVGAEINETREFLDKDNVTLGTFIHVSAVIPERGLLSHWELLASKPGKIRVQVFRPYRNTTNHSCQNQSCSSQENSCFHTGKIACCSGKALCLSWKQCVPTDNAQHASYNCTASCEVSSKLDSDYQLWLEHTLNIRQSGYHVILIPRSKRFPVEAMDVIGWTSDGGQLGYLNNTLQKHIMVEYPVTGHPGSILSRNNYTKMHFGTHALTVYVRQPVHFELDHVYSNTGVYKISSSATQTIFITVDDVITPFELKFPRLSTTNSSILFQTGNHNGSGVTYYWDFGDTSAVNSSNSSVTHIYYYPNWFTITLLATNALSNYSLVAKIEVLDPIKECRFSQSIKAAVLGQSSFVKWRCRSGSNVSFLVNWGDGFMNYSHSKSNEMIGSNFSHIYSTAGNFSVKVLASSPVGTNTTLTSQALVQVPITGLQIFLPFLPQLETLYLTTSSEVTVECDLQRETHVDCEFSFGDSNTSVVHSGRKVNHTYNTPGTYRITATCYNLVSSIWGGLNTTFIVQDLVPLKNITLSVLPAIFGAPSVFQMRIPSGNFFRCYWDFGDGQRLNIAFPLINTSIKHLYKEVGTYTMNVTCRNDIGDSSVTVLADVDEPIRNATIVNEAPFVEVNQSVEFLLQWKKGSRVQCCIDCDDNPYNKRHVANKNVTMVTIKHAYLQPGRYSIVARLWNSVSSSRVSVSRQIIVEYPVKGIQFFLARPSRCQSLSIASCVNVSADITPPSNASAFFDFGDGSSTFLENLDFSRKMCVQKHNYAHPGLYNITVNVTNYVSSQFLMVSAYVGWSPLKGIWITYKNGSIFQQGLGSGKQYFPTGSTLRFELRQDRGDVDFEWKIGNKSLEQARKSVVEQVFRSRGCVNVTAIIKSLTLHEHCPSRICIQDKLQDLELNVKRPTYFKDATVFTFSAKNENACFALNLGDNTTVRFGDVSCRFLSGNLTTYSHKYKTQGNYTVELLSWNQVSSVRRTIKVSIWDEACPLLSVIILGGGPKDRPLIVTSSEVVVLEPVVIQKCYVAKAVIIRWEVFVVKYKEPGGKKQRMELLHNVQREVISRNLTDDVEREQLSIVVRSLPTELFMVKLSVGFTGTDRDLGHVNGSNYTWLEVVRPPLVARIKGGISRSVPWKSLFILDGSESYDPDNMLDPAMIQFSWSCLVINTSLSWTSNTTFDPSSRCFKNDSAILSNSNIITFSATNLFLRQKYIFRLQMKEGTRKSYFEQTVVVVDGSIPAMDLSCLLNCEETVNPTQRLVLESKCSNCEPSSRLVYKWSIYVCSTTNNTGKPSCNEIPNFGLNTSTGLHQANLATLPNVLDIATSYKVRCTAWRSGSDSVGFVEYLFTVNRPPSGGNCTVTPKEGYALESKFSVHCVGWYDDDKPLTYLIEMLNGENTVYLSSGNQPNMTVYLPLGEAEKNFTIVVTVKVVDSKLFSANSLHAVKVFQPDSLDYEQAVDDVREAIYAKEKNAGFGMVISLCSILNHRFNSSKQSLVEAKEIRKNIAKILSKTNITGFDEVRGISNSFQTLTAKPNEVGLETQSEVMRTIQSNMAVLHRLSDTSRDIADIGTSLHTVVSNIVEAALLENATMATELHANATKGMNKTNVETRELESIKEAFQTLDQINNVMLSQVVAGDRPTVIKTTNYDVHLMRQSLEDLTMDNRNSTDLQVKFQDAASLLEHSNLTLLSVLGFTVIDLSKSPNSFYNLSADQVNSNVLRLNLNDMNGSPVDLSKVGVDIFVERKSDDVVENIAEINTLSSWKAMEIHKFNRTTQDTALVIKLQPVDSRIKFQALLRVGQAPDGENYDFQNEFPNTTSSSPPFTWVLSHDLLRQFSSSASQEYFLGVKLSEREVGVKFNYSLRLFWAKCLMLDDGEDVWKSSGCKVGLRTSLRRTHCVCRPSQPQFSSDNAHHDSRVQRSTSNSRHARSTKEKTFTKKGIFKISVGAGVFPTPNKIDFRYVFDADISDNPLALIAVSTAFGVFLIVLIYARRQDRKDSEKIGASPLYDNDPSDKYFCEITVHTGCVYDAGTTANVSIILSGSEADVRPRTLWDPRRQCFQRGGIDTFLVSSPDYIGGITYLQVWHDNTGPTPAWCLDKVVVRDLNDNKSYLFINETWLAVEKGQGTVQTVLFPASKQEMTEFKHLFNTTTQKSLKDRHLWFSVFARPVDSRFTRVQRLSCCLTLLYCTMLTNAMFYQKTGTPKSESTVTIGPFTFGVDEIGIGIISAFIILPPNVIFVWIFRSVKSKPSEEEIRAMKEKSKFWWFYELFSCCFKSQQSFLVMMSRGITEYLYGSNANVQREDQNEKDCSPPSDELVVDTEVKVQIPKESIQMLRKSKRLQTSIVLPYWYIYVAWSGLCLTSITCVFFVVLYGLQFGRDVSARWLSSVTVSIIQDVFISEPLKVFAIATVVALIIKKPPKLEREEESSRTFQYHQPLDENNNMKEACERLHAKPPLKKDLEKARAKRLKEIRTCALLKELGLYVFFLLCLSVVTYRNKNPLSYEMNKAMNDMFVVKADGAGKSFEQISDVESFYTWANATLLDGLYSRLSSYNRRLSPTEAESAVLGNLKLIGQVRLRQTRVKQNSCVVHKYFRNEIKQCHGWYSSVNKDTACYDVGWTPLANGSQCDPSLTFDPWKFLSGSRHTAGDQTLTTTPYDGGGFVVDFQRSNFTDNSKTIAFLRKHNWLDSRTREIFIEFNVYSASLNLFCLSKFAIEVLPTNGMIKQARFTVTKLFALSGVLDLFSIVSHVFIFVFFLIFIYREAKQVYRLKLKYLSNFWHVLQGVIVLLILACVVIFFLRLAMVNQLLTTLENNQSLFMTFDHVAFIDMLLTRLVAFLVFLSWIRVTKFLRFNKRLLFLQDTLRKIAKPITAFSIVLLTLFVAYAHSGYLLFRELPTFRDVPTTFVSVSSLLMGHFDFPALESSNRILGPVFLFSAMFFGVFILMNLFIALILESFLLVKAQATRQENKYDLLQFVAKQLRGWIGTTGSQSPSIKSLEDTQQEPCHSGVMCDQSARQTKCLKDHIRKKERVLKMAERCVSRLELGLESVLLEDWAEEMVFHKLLIKSMSLARSDWFNKEADIEEHYGNEQPGQKLHGKYPKATTTSYEEFANNNNTNKDQCVSSFNAQRPLSTSDLIIEEIQFQRF